MRLANWTQFKVRTDLQVSTQAQEGVLYHVIKDPITLRYFRLRPAEYAIFRMLDGETPAPDIMARLRSLGYEVTEDEFKLFLKQLGAANFFENVLPNQSESLYQTAMLRRARRSLWQQVKRILYIKIPLCDPDRAFTRVMPYVRFLWSPWAAAVYAAMILFGFYAFFAKYEEATRDFSWLLTPEALFLLGIVIMVIKIVHELGHGLTCKRFGGEVHDMGILALVLIPCLYCNISDAWIMNKRSHKMWTSAAGIIAELLVAALAAFVWYFTPPGTLNSMALRVMILSGGYSVIFNANPLMKWDGYYILSDILAMPNLRANSVRYLGQFFRKYLLGMDTPTAGRFDRSRLIQLIYGVLSTIWIFAVMYRITRSMLASFPALGVWVLVSTLYGFILIPTVRLARFFVRRGGRAGNVNLRRLSYFSAAMALGVYFFFVYDMGYSVTAPCVIEPGRHQLLMAGAPGTLVYMPWSQGDTVREGETIARLENKELELTLKDTLVQIDSVDLKIDQARGQRETITIDILSDDKKRLEKYADEVRELIDSLTMKAPFAGVILTPSPRSQIGRFLNRGSFVCEVADFSEARVTIAVPGNSLRFVKKASEAFVSLRAYPWREFRGAVDLISDAPLTSLPSGALSSAAGGAVLTRPDIQTARVPLENLYQVGIALPNSDKALLAGMVGDASISGGRRHLYDIVYVAVRENLRRSFGL